MKNTCTLLLAMAVVAGGGLICRAAAPQSNKQPANDNAAVGNAPAQHDVAPTQDDVRVQSGLLALYDFQDSTGNVVRDRSGVGEPLDLQIVAPAKVRRTPGALEVRAGGLIRSRKPAAKIINAVRRSGAITIETWLRPANTKTKGPGRIVTLSANGSERNVTLGQERNQYDVRLRTTSTSTNGIPSVSSPKKSLAAKRAHVVYTRDRTGRARIYIDGKQVVEKTVAGATLNWSRAYHLGLGNELSQDRPWLGTFYLVAVYGRDLRSQEVARNFQAGPKLGVRPASVAKAVSPAHQFFETQVAPLLAKHCLECHSTTAKKGELDLSRKESALAGGESGPAIVPGKAEESLLFQSVDSDEMPLDRPALSGQEKALLRRWLDDGADWSLPVIDAAAFKRRRVAKGNWLRRLTVSEYIATVRSAVGVDIAKEALAILPPDIRADGFSNTAYNLTVDLEHIEAYADLAQRIVDKIDVSAFAAKYTSSKKITDKNMRPLIANMGKWILRGPLEEHEVATFRGVSTTVAAAGGNFEEAVRFVLEAMLQSPRFIYRIENQRGDGLPWPVGDYELASRLSYILWGGPPDEQLIKAADAGRLYEQKDVEKQVRRMLQDPRAVERSMQFMAEWLDLNRLQHLAPNAARFPSWDKRLAEDMRTETLEFFKDVAWKQKRPLADLLNAQLTYATPRLAKHYGLKPQAAGLARYDLHDTPSRGGLLTQGSVLTVGGDEASMVARGLFILKDILRGSVADPPPGLDTTPVPTSPGLTQRGIAAERIANGSCGGCHIKFEPLAFGLEKFDGIGAFHERDEHGNKLRDDGKMVFPGGGAAVGYQTSAELMNLLAASEQVQKSLTWKVTQFSLGRPLIEADAPILEKIYRQAQEDGGTYASLMTAIVMSDLVQKTSTEKEP